MILCFIDDFFRLTKIGNYKKIDKSGEINLHKLEFNTRN